MTAFLVNGCSFVAGDDIAWDYEQYPNYLDAADEIHQEYKQQRRQQYNLAGQLAQRTGKTVIDLSRDGVSNMEIMLTTRSYLAQLSDAERRDLHVFIGWTSRLRRCQWSPSLGVYKSVTPGNIAWSRRKRRDDDYWQSYYRDFDSWVPDFMASQTQLDYLDDLAVVMSMETQLAAWGVSWTFCNMLNDPVARQLQSKLSDQFGLDVKNCLRDDRWLGDRSEGMAYFSRSWGEYLAQDAGKYLTANKHPNQQAVAELVNLIVTEL